MGRCPFCSSITAIININASLNEYYCLNKACGVYPLYYKTLKNIQTSFEQIIAYSLCVNDFWIKRLDNGAFFMCKMNHNYTPLIFKTPEANFDPFDFVRKIDKLEEKLKTYITLS